MWKEADTGKWRVVLVVASVAVAFLAAWWLLPPQLYRHTEASPEAELKAITDTRIGLLAGLVGLGALLTFWLNRKLYRISSGTLAITEQGHITDRYTKAIEQLGAKKVDVRLPRRSVDNRRCAQRLHT